MTKWGVPTGKDFRMNFDHFSERSSEIWKSLKKNTANTTIPENEILPDTVLFHILCYIKA